MLCSLSTLGGYHLFQKLMAEKSLSGRILAGVWFQRLKTCKNAEKLGKGIAYIEVCRVICKLRKEKTSF